MIRPIRIEGDVAYVPLTRGYEVVIDAEDAPLVSGHNWCAYVQPHTVYAKRGIKANGRAITVLMHRVILGAPAGVLVDHADCNGSNNRKANLRAATSSQNCFNQRTRANNKSGYKGVFSRGRRWGSQIKVDGKCVYLGTFDTPEAAYAAYCVANVKLRGDFARVA